MKILPLNSVNNNNFKGLWGQTKNHQCQYYPFSDETPEQIDKANDNFCKDEKVKELGLAMTVMAALPFTSVDFLRYTTHRLNITKERRIDRVITSKDLSLVKKLVK